MGLSEVMSADVRTMRDDADVEQILGDMDIATRDSLDKAELASSLGEISAPAEPAR